MQLRRASGDLVLKLLETPAARIEAPVLLTYFPHLKKEIIKSGLMTRVGLSTSPAGIDADEEDPNDVFFSQDHQEWGLYDACGTWTALRDDERVVYGIDLTKIYALMLAKCERIVRAPPSPLLADLVWDLGAIRLQGQRFMVPVWFARRLSEPSVWTSLQDLLARRPPETNRIVLTTTVAEALPLGRLMSNEIISVWDVLAEGASFSVDPGILAARLRHGDPPTMGALWHSAEFDTVRVHGQPIVFKSSKQRHLLRQLFEAYEAGDPICLTARVLENAGYAPNTNTLAKVFSGRTDWRKFIQEDGGRCWVYSPAGRAEG